MELFYNPNYFSEDEMNHIKDHKYETTGYSKLDNLMNPFWEACANRIPYVNISHIKYSGYRQIWSR